MIIYNNLGKEMIKYIYISEVFVKT